MHRFIEFWRQDNAASKVTFPVGWTGEDLCHDMQRMLQMAETYYVSSDIEDVITEVGHKMPPERLQAPDLPSTHGFQVFEKPLLQTDVHGMTVPVRAIAWAQRIVGRSDLGQHPDPGVVFWTFSDLDDKHIDDYFNVVDGDVGKQTKRLIDGLRQQHLRFLPYTVYTVSFNTYALEFASRPGVVGTFVGTLGGPGVGNEQETFERLPNGKWLFDPKDPKYSQQQFIMLQSRDEDPHTHRPHMESFEPSNREDGKLEVIPEPVSHYQQALWRFMSQEIAAIEHPHTRKTTARMLMRRQLRADPLTLIRLRRRARGVDQGTSFEYSHRFVVRGHWRRQWYPSEQRHRSIYIRPFIKGPDDAPLLAREHVIGVVR